MRASTASTSRTRSTSPTGPASRRTCRVDKELFLKLLDERRATSHVKEAKDDGKIADLSGTYNDRWKVR